jgi:hypothetical protein
MERTMAVNAILLQPLTALVAGILVLMITAAAELHRCHLVGLSGLLPQLSG